MKKTAPKRTDLVFSLGPTCRNAWNLRKNLGIELSYPFDWWITPAKSMLKMIEPGFQFHIDRDDLHITPPHERNTVYNYKLNIVHQHDFTRDPETGLISSITDQDIENANSKYRGRFARLFDSVRDASHPIAVLGGYMGPLGNDGSFRCIPTNPEFAGHISLEDLAREIRDRLGNKLRVAFIRIGPATTYQEFDWGWIVQFPDLGIRESAHKSQDYAEPMHVFRLAYALLNFSLEKDSGGQAPSDSKAT